MSWKGGEVMVKPPGMVKQGWGRRVYSGGGVFGGFGWFDWGQPPFLL